MRMTPIRTLNAEQLRFFFDRGYVVVKGCIPEAVAREWVAGGWKRAGASPDDPKTWKEGIVHLPYTRGAVIRDFAPKAWGAMCDLLGGEDRIREPGKQCWSDTFIINFPYRGKEEWASRSSYTGNWHIDSPDPKNYTQYLDSAELCLISMVAWTKMGPGYGGTEVACDSVAPVARFLKDRPEGVTTRTICTEFFETPFSRREFLEVEAGDVVLMHPHLIHRSVANPSNHVRFITTQMHALREPLRFDRGEASPASPLEVSVLRAVGATSLPFKREP